MPHSHSDPARRWNPWCTIGQSIRISGGLVVFAALVLIGAGGPSAPAAPPPPGTGGGTIYFMNSGAVNSTWSVNPDGTNRTQLYYWSVFTYPSKALHNNHRWFISQQPVAGTYPDGVTGRGEIIAYREDYDYNLNNNPSTRVPLTSSDTLQPISPTFSGIQWIAGDQGISFRARRWALDGSIVQGGIYTATLAFGADGNIIGLTAQPGDPALAIPLDANGYPDFLAHTWSPTGDRVAYTNAAGTGLWVANLLANTRTQIVSGAVSYPDWSPDGTRIAFAMNASMYTIRPDGTGAAAVIQPVRLHGTNWTLFSHPYFSPSGGFITCVGVDASGGSDVFRATASGGSLTNLTNTASTSNETPTGWGS